MFSLVSKMHMSTIFEAKLWDKSLLVANYNFFKIRWVPSSASEWVPLALRVSQTLHKAFISMIDGYSNEIYNCTTFMHFRVDERYPSLLIGCWIILEWIVVWVWDTELGLEVHLEYKFLDGWWYPIESYIVWSTLNCIQTFYEMELS